MQTDLIWMEFGSNRLSIKDRTTETEGSRVLIPSPGDPWGKTRDDSSAQNSSSSELR